MLLLMLDSSDKETVKLLDCDLLGDFVTDLVATRVRVRVLDDEASLVDDKVTEASFEGERVSDEV